MSTETNQEVVADTTNGEGEGQSDTVTVSKKDYDTLNQSLGSLKRELKDLRKAQESKPEVTDTPKKTEAPKELDYSQKAFLKASGMNTKEEMQEAWDFAKRTGLDLDAVLEDDIFKARIEKMRTTKANELAASGSSGKGGTGGGRNTVEYWLAKGEHPPKELGSKLAVEYVQAKRNQGKNAKVFYND